MAKISTALAEDRPDDLPEVMLTNSDAYPPFSTERTCTTRSIPSWSLSHMVHCQGTDVTSMMHTVSSVLPKRWAMHPKQFAIVLSAGSSKSNKWSTPKWLNTVTFTQGLATRGAAGGAFAMARGAKTVLERARSSAGGACLPRRRLRHGRLRRSLAKDALRSFLGFVFVFFFGDPVE
jgi:hypothetical protein